AAADLGQRAALSGDRTGAARLSERAALPAAGPAAARAPVPVHPRPVRLQQAAPRAGATARRGDHAARPALTLLLRPATSLGLDTGALRGLARDRPPLAAGWLRRLRLLPLAQPLVLGLPPLSALRPRRAAGRLRARPGERARARGRSGAA